MSQSLREKGRRQLAEAQEAYKSSKHPAASGVVLHRKDRMVLDGKFKWVPCVWTFRGENTLLLTPFVPADDAAGKKDDAPKEDAFEIREGSAYTKPKTKHHPIQFGSEVVHSSVLLEKVMNAPTGTAPSALDHGMHRPGSEEMHAVCKLGALDLADLEKILKCVQAVIEGKAADAYL